MAQPHTAQLYGTENSKELKPHSVVAYYVRKLPHWQPEGADLFVTWRLQGSKPHTAGGPLWLKDPLVAQCVSEVLIAGAERWRLYELQAWVIMSNHVHMLVQPLVPLHKALMNIKSASARAANTIIGKTGEHFWQRESFDRWMRDDRERARAIWYIENNPVTAGLVSRPEEWPWSSAGWKKEEAPHGAAPREKEEAAHGAAPHGAAPRCAEN